MIFGPSTIYFGLWGDLPQSTTRTGVVFHRIVATPTSASTPSRFSFVTRNEACDSFWTSWDSVLPLIFVFRPATAG